MDYYKGREIPQSMSKAGCPYDNAPMEPFYNTFKNEPINQNKFESADSLDKADATKIANYRLTFWIDLREYSTENETRQMLEIQNRL